MKTYNIYHNNRKINVKPFSQQDINNILSSAKNGVINYIKDDNVISMNLKEVRIIKNTLV